MFTLLIISQLPQMLAGILVAPFPPPRYLQRLPGPVHSEKSSEAKLLLCEKRAAINVGFDLLSPEGCVWGWGRYFNQLSPVRRESQTGRTGLIVHQRNKHRLYSLVSHIKSHTTALEVFIVVLKANCDHFHLLPHPIIALGERFLHAKWQRILQTLESHFRGNSIKKILQCYIWGTWGLYYWKLCITHETLWEHTEETRWARTPAGSMNMIKVATARLPARGQQKWDRQQRWQAVLATWRKSS